MDTLLKLFGPHHTAECISLFEKLQFFGTTALATWSTSKNTGSYICHTLDNLFIYFFGTSLSAEYHLLQTLLYELEAQASC